MKNLINRQSKDIEIIEQLMSPNPDTIERALARNREDYRAIEEFIPRVKEEDTPQLLAQQRAMSRQKLYGMLSHTGFNSSPGHALQYYSQWGKFSNYSWGKIGG